MTLPIGVYVQRLELADELETAQRVARARGLSVEELLERRSALDAHAHGITELYSALRDRGYSPRRIAEFTGRTSQAVHQSLRYHTDEAYRTARKAAAAARHRRRKVEGLAP